MIAPALRRLVTTSRRPADDDYRGRFERAFDRMVPIRDMSDHAAAELIARDEIDIAIDLAGWTKRTRPAVLAARPASMQLQWLGYAGTFGAPWIDYIVADRVLIRREDEHYFSEKIIRLPRTYQANDDKRVAAETQGRSSYGLPETRSCSARSTSPSSSHPTCSTAGSNCWRRSTARCSGGLPP
jgi:predicted O-linked N-acetylglucosamine transferase (SPINDLY family)